MSNTILPGQGIAKEVYQFESSQEAEIKQSFEQGGFI